MRAHVCVSVHAHADGVASFNHLTFYNARMPRIKLVISSQLFVRGKPNVDHGDNCGVCVCACVRVCVCVCAQAQSVEK